MAGKTPLNVRIDEDLKERLRAIGNGNMTEGIGNLVDFYDSEMRRKSSGTIHVPDWYLSPEVAPREDFHSWASGLPDTDKSRKLVRRFVLSLLDSSNDQLMEFIESDILVEDSPFYLEFVKNWTTDILEANGKFEELVSWKASLEKEISELRASKNDQLKEQEAKEKARFKEQKDQLESELRHLEVRTKNARETWEKVSALVGDGTGILTEDEFKDLAYAIGKTINRVNEEKGSNLTRILFKVLAVCKVDLKSVEGAKQSPEALATPRKREGIL